MKKLTLYQEIKWLKEVTPAAADVTITLDFAKRIYRYVKGLRRDQKELNRIYRIQKVY